MEIRLEGEARKQFRRLNEPALSRVAEAINGLKKEPLEGDIIPLKGRKQWRLRVGDYRILFAVCGGLILVTHIESRGQAYKKKTRGNK